MSYRATVNNQVSLAGKGYGEQRTVEGEGLNTKEKTALAAAKTGNLTTRTDDDTGELTMDAGHSITTGQRLDVYWDGGRRYGMTVGTVAGNAVPIDGGAGDNLPADESEITAFVPIEENFLFDGDDLQLLVASGTRKGLIVLEDAGGVELAIDLDEDQMFRWDTGDGSANPVVGDDITKAFFSNGDSAGTANLRIAALVN